MAVPLHLLAYFAIIENECHIPWQSASSSDCCISLIRPMTSSELFLQGQSARERVTWLSPRNGVEQCAFLELGLLARVMLRL